MNLIDAVSSNTIGRSVVELSLNPVFERGYSALFKGVANLSKKTNLSQGPILKPQENSSEPTNQPKERSEKAGFQQPNASSHVTNEAEEPPRVANQPQQTPSEGHHQSPAASEAGAGAKAGAGAGASAGAGVGAGESAQTPEEAQQGPPEGPHHSPAAPEAEESAQTPKEPQSAGPEAGESAQVRSQSPATPELSTSASLAPPETVSCRGQAAPEGAQDNSPSTSETLIAQATDQPIISALEARRRLEHQLQSVVVPYLPSPQKRPFHLFAVDVTSQPRQFSPTLEDRGFVYQPNTIKGNKPITIGHQYSVVAYLPEKIGPSCPPWVVPLSTRRIATCEDKELVGLEQVQTLIKNQNFEFHHQLSIQVADTAYSKRSFLHESAKNENLVTVARVRSDRTFYRQYQAPEGTKAKAGHPIWYGERFSLKKPESWHEADQVAETSFVSRRGKQYTVKMQAWENMLMKGKDGIAMHEIPFTLIRIRCLNSNGKSAFKKDLWLIVVGKRRYELNLLDLYEVYRQRFDIEHYFRFGKQKLLMTAFQTPEVEREENWWQIVQLAYTQLWLAGPLAQHLPRPWEKYLPHPEGQIPSPSQVQRDFGRIIRQLGTPANSPKVRHKGTGRSKGETLPPRPRHAVVKKGKKSQVKKTV
ncbi:MAG: transposase [Ardenticatenaceae bacterium]